MCTIKGLPVYQDRLDLTNNSAQHQAVELEVIQVLHQQYQADQVSGAQHLVSQEVNQVALREAFQAAHHILVVNHILEYHLDQVFQDNLIHQAVFQANHIPVVVALAVFRVYLDLLVAHHLLVASQVKNYLKF